MLRGAALAVLFLLGGIVPARGQGPVHTPRVHALVDARVVMAPGRVLERGTIILRDGVIEAVGARVAVPPDARVWKLDSLTVYAGLIDPLFAVSPASTAASEERGGGQGSAAAKVPSEISHDLAMVTPELVLADRLEMKPADREARRGQGITTLRAIPDKGVFRGHAAVLNLGDGDLGKNLLRRDAGQVLAFDIDPREVYPASVMGTVAVLRQTFLDARWYARAQAAYAARPAGVARPEVNTALEELADHLEKKEPFLFVTDDAVDLLRAHELAGEFDLVFEFTGSGQEYKHLDAIARFVRSLVVPVNFPEPPSVESQGTALTVSLETLRHWDAAPGNPARLHAEGIAVAFTASGLKDVGQFRKNVAKTITAGLPEDAALAAVTVTPARMLGLSDRLGTIEAGKIANLVVTDGALFSDSTHVRAVWIDGERYEVEESKPPQGDARGTWELSGKMGSEDYPFVLTLGGEVGALVATVRFMGTDVPATATQSGTSVTVSYPGEAIGVPGTIRFTITIAGDSATGSGTSSAGEFTVNGTRTAKPGEAEHRRAGTGGRGGR